MCGTFTVHSFTLGKELPRLHVRVACALWMPWFLTRLEWYARMCNFVVHPVIISHLSSAGPDRPLLARRNGLFVFWLPVNTIISIHKWDIASSCLLLCAYSHSLLFLSHYLNLAHTQTSPSAFVSLLLPHTCPLGSYLPLSCCFANLGTWN